MKAEEPTWKRDLTKRAQNLIEEHFEVQKMMNKLRIMREAKEELSAKIDTLEGEITEQIRGRKREDLPSMDDARRTYRYNSDEDEKCFQRYPEPSRKIMVTHCKRMLRKLIREHPIGARLKKLQEQSDTFEDRIAACGSHTQIQTIWHDICGQLDIFELDIDATREKRKVDTTRARRKKAAKTE